MESKYCPWCMDKNGKTDLDFSVIGYGWSVHAPKQDQILCCVRQRAVQRNEEAKGGRA